MEAKMNYFIIETHKLKDLENGWKPIATTTILADNSFQALIKVNESHGGNQYSHQVIYIIDARYEEETTNHSLTSSK